RARVEAMMMDARAMMARVREIEPSISAASLPAPVQDVYRWVVDHLSLTLELEWTRVIAHLDHDPVIAAALADIRAALVSVVLAEQRARTTFRSPVADSVENAEHLNYRAGVLKKFVRSVLFLELARGQDGRRITEAVAAIAAGTAMLIST